MPACHACCEAASPTGNSSSARKTVKKLGLADELTRSAELPDFPAEPPLPYWVLLLNIFASGNSTTPPPVLCECMLAASTASRCTSASRASTCATRGRVAHVKGCTRFWEGPAEPLLGAGLRTGSIGELSEGCQGCQHIASSTACRTQTLLGCTDSAVPAWEFYALTAYQDWLSVAARHRKPLRCRRPAPGQLCLAELRKGEWPRPRESDPDSTNQLQKSGSSSSRVWSVPQVLSWQPKWSTARMQS